MRSTSRGSKKKYPEKYDDPLGMDEIAVEGDQTTRLPPTTPVVLTGLSDEEDARRHVAREFDPDLWQCPNCEGFYDISDLRFNWCPYCGDNLHPIGSVPIRKRKFTSR